jgi:hypothetical protein
MTLKMSKFLQILAILNSVFISNLFIPSQFIVYNILSIPSPLYGCEFWTLKRKDIKEDAQKIVYQTIEEREIF